jgi:hypothetical protein
MDTSSGSPGGPCGYELVFTPLHQGRSFAFPCSEEGVVDLDHLAEQALNNYLLARGLVGRDFQVPTIVSVGTEQREGPASPVSTR